MINPKWNLDTTPSFPEAQGSLWKRGGSRIKAEAVDEEEGKKLRDTTAQPCPQTHVGCVSTHKSLNWATFHHGDRSELGTQS